MAFPTVFQKDSMQCGVACLSIVCEHFGKKYSLDFLERYCFPTTEGVSLKAISDAASDLGLETHGGLVAVTSLRNLPLPCILHWNQSHFVVLYKISPDGTRFHISDPGKGLVTYTLSEFEDKWVSTVRDNVPKGIALFVERTDKFGRINDSGTADRRSFGFLLRYLYRYRACLCQILAGLTLGCVLQLILPFLTQWIVDIGISHKDIGLVWLILVGELLIVLGRAATDFVRRWLLLHISMRINISLVSDFFIKLFKLPMSFFDSKLMGDLIQRMGDHGRIQNFLTGQVLSITFSILSFLIYGVVLLMYDRMIFYIFAFGSICYGAWVASFLRKRKVIDYELFEQQAVNQNRTYQLISSIQEIKLQDCERRRRWEWEDSQADLFSVQMKSMKLSQTQQAGSIFLNEVKNIIITVMAATAVIDGRMTLGAMLAVQYIVGQLNSPVSQLMSFVYSLQDVKISLERINEIHGKENEDSDMGDMDEFNGERKITLTGANFKYDPHSTKKTIDDVSFEIPEGKVTALVGASGSGKTTLVKLMLGYYPLLSGTIKIAGKEIADYNLKWWRRQCGVVMQDGVIFSESIARNIAVDDGDIDESRLVQAAALANIHDYVTSLPLGYNTKIGPDGVGISQGQKQRILIARAVYKNPQFIFLDEATNSLDTRNERTIVKNLEQFYSGRTVVVVAHRLSTVRSADNIIVLDSGKVVESGDHDTLIKNKGAYYNLIKNQLELAI